MSDEARTARPDDYTARFFYLRVVMGVYAVLSTGLVIVCLTHGIPNRLAAQVWPLYALVLLGPYDLSLIACRPPRSRLVNVCVVVVLLAGCALMQAALLDYMSARRGQPPAMPASALVAGVALMIQYTAALTALAIWQFARTGSEPRSGGRT